jgi:hypothetical protein
VLKSQVITSQFSFSAQSTTTTSRVSSMKFYLFKYALNGTFLGNVTMSSELEMCSNFYSPVQLMQWSFFGSYAYISCSLSLQTLNQTTGTGMTFYDLYMLEGDKVYPVPVKILNYVDEKGNTPNSGSSGEVMESGALALHRRFFLVDNISSKITAGGGPSVIQYAQRIVLRINMRSTDSIHPPVLVISYAQRDTSVDMDSTLTALSFRAEYTSVQTVSVFAQVFLALLIVLMGILTMVKLNTWNRLNNTTGATVYCSTYVWKLFSFAFYYCGECLFWVAFAVSAYFLVFFKMQSSPFVLLPLEGDKQYESFKILVGFAFAAQLLGVFQLIWEQVNQDIFFADWERPRTLRDPGEKGRNAVANSGFFHYFRFTTHTLLFLCVSPRRI